MEDSQTKELHLGVGAGFGLGAKRPKESFAHGDLVRLK